MHIIMIMINSYRFIMIYLNGKIHQFLLLFDYALGIVMPLLKLL